LLYKQSTLIILRNTENQTRIPTCVCVPQEPPRYREVFTELRVLITVIN